MSKKSKSSTNIRFSQISEPNYLEYYEKDYERDDSLIDQSSALIDYFYTKILKSVIVECSEVPADHNKDSDEEPTYDTEPPLDLVEEDTHSYNLAIICKLETESKLRSRIIQTQSQARFFPNVGKSKSIKIAECTQSSNTISKHSQHRSTKIRYGSTAKPSTRSSLQFKTQTLLSLLEEDAASLSNEGDNYKVTSMSWLDYDNPETKTMCLEFTTGATYCGNVVKHRFHGKGWYRWPNGTIYEGEFKDGTITGFGKLTFYDMTYYQGAFENCIFEGAGTYCPHGSAVYYGSWSNGLPHGKGRLSYSEVDSYDGEWKFGQKHGQGTRVYSNKAIYSGLWKNSNPSGIGSMVFANRDFYHGQWENGQPNGYGKYTWSAKINDGMTFSIEKQYEGHFVNGLRDGYGVQIFGMEGSKVACQFDDNMKSGAGILICGDGTTIEKKPLFVMDNPVALRTSTMSDKNLFLKEIVGSRIDTTFGRASTRGVPMCLPLHATAKDVSVEYHIEKLMVYHSSSGTSKELEIEFLQKAIANNYVYLRQVYQKYATLNLLHVCNPEVRNPALSRLRLWQFFRDINVCQFKISLVDVDLMMLEVPNNHLESEHNPFETIYFWQFMHCLLLLSYTRYTMTSDKPEQQFIKYPTFRKIFKTFIDEVIRPSEGTFKGRALFSLKDLVPIQQVYNLYKSIGDPHSARTLLQRICCCKGKFTYDCMVKHRKVYDLQGTHKHYVIGGSTIVYLQTDKKSPWELREPAVLNKYADDPYYTDLKVFRVLGPKKILECITEVCPIIKKEDDIVHMNYQITCLEFYEILIHLAEELSKIKKMEEEQFKKVPTEERMTEEVTTSASKAKKKGKKQKPKSLAASK